MNLTVSLFTPQFNYRDFFLSLPIISAECPHRLSKLFVKELVARAEQVSGIL